MQIINGCSTPGIAAAIATNYNGTNGGFPYWLLPTTEALEMAYHNLHLKGIGNFQNSAYSTSVNYSHQDFALAFSFQTGGVFVTSRDQILPVRAISAFALSQY